MISHELAAVVLPPRFQEVEAACNSITERAKIIETDLNVTNTTNEVKRHLLLKAINDLDRESMGIFFGQHVQIDGTYNFATTVTDLEGMHVISVNEFGIRRGISMGFSGNMKCFTDQNGEVNPYDQQVTLSHLLRLGSVALHSNRMQVEAVLRLEAPVNESSLSIAAIEDYKTGSRAESAVRKSKNGARWLEDFNEALYNKSGPNFNAVGTLLTRRASLRPAQLDDCLTYVNNVLGLQDQDAYVLCDYLIDYVVSREEPRLRRPDTIISGKFTGISFAPVYTRDSATAETYRLSTPKPVLIIQAQIVGDDEEHTLHIPLASIRAAEFK